MASGSDTYVKELSEAFSSDYARSSSTPKDRYTISSSRLVPFVDLITRPRQRNQRARRIRPLSPLIKTPDISPRKRKLQTDDSPEEKLSSKVYKFYSEVTINAEPMFQLIQMALERQVSPTASEYMFDVRGS